MVNDTPSIKGAIVTLCLVKSTVAEDERLRYCIDY